MEIDNAITTIIIIAVLMTASIMLILLGIRNFGNARLIHECSESPNEKHHWHLENIRESIPDPHCNAGGQVKKILDKCCWCKLTRPSKV